MAPGARTCSIDYLRGIKSIEQVMDPFVIDVYNQLSWL